MQSELNRPAMSAAAHGLAKNPHDSMTAWDRSWKPHHLPMWARKSIRLDAIKKDNWRAYPGWPVNNHAEAHLPHELFDHWGSVKRGKTRALIAQPYGEHDALAKSFASELGWSVKSFTPGPWNDGTWCYEFLPNNAQS
jgi:hypothetical protein